MKDNRDINEKFHEYFNELEGFTLRSERFYAEFEAGIMRERRIIEWMEAAFIEGYLLSSRKSPYNVSISNEEKEALRGWVDLEESK